MRWRFEALTTEDGLPSNTIETFHQDQKGFIWVGTWGGLARYDGYSFRVYRHNAEDPHSLSGDIVHDIEEDRAGNFWVATNSGLDKFDPSRGRFTHFVHDPANSNSPAFADIFRLLLNDDDTLWLGTSGGGLDHFDPSTGQFTHYAHDPDDPESLGGNEVRALARDSEGALWVGTQGGGLNRFLPASGTFERFSRDSEDPRSIGDDGVWALAETSDGSFWVGLNDAGLNRLDRETGEFERFNPDPGDPTALGGKFVFDLQEDSPGGLWVALHDSGLFWLDRSTGQFTPSPPDLAAPSSVEKRALTTLFEDDLGVLWIGTFNHGISKLDREAAKFRLYEHEPTNLQSMTGSHVQALLEDRQGNLWVGTEGSGLSKFDPASGAYSHYHNDPADPRSLSDDKILGFYEDRDGVLWIATRGKGLNRFDPTTNVFERFVHDPDDPESLGSDNADAVFETTDGTLWVSAGYGGLNRLDRRTGRFTRYLHDPENPQSLGRGVANVMIGDAKNQLWIGLWGGGLSRFDPATGLFTRYEADPEDPGAISHDEVWALHHDDQGQLWVGTSAGLDRFDPTTGSFLHYRLTDGEGARTVHVIVSDLSGDLWLGTGNGLCRFDPVDETFEVYDKRDGLQGRGWTDGAAVRAKSGEVFIGGPGGLNAFFPEDVVTNPRPPPVVLTDFQIFNQTVAIGGEGSPLDVSITDTDVLTLRHDQSVFTITFAGLNYRSPEKNRYRFKLDGVDTDWNEVTSERRYATYTTLAPGTYRFDVKASNNDGVWSENSRSLMLHILPPYWQTWWFRSLALLLAGALVWGGFLLRTTQIREQNLALQEEIKERRKVEDSLQKSNLELEARNAEMERFTYSVSHDLKNPLVTIRGFAGSLRRDLERGEQGKISSDLQRIEKAAERMQHLLQDLLELSRVGRVAHNPEPVDLSILVQEVAELLAPSFERLKVAVSIAPDMPSVHGDRIRLGEVLQNLMENAAKFMGEQRAPLIKVRAGIEGDEVVCTVEDNGVGIDSTYQEKVFELFERLDQRVEGTGVGLALVQRIIEFHGGRVWVDSAGPGQGSRFHFALPRP